MTSPENIPTPSIEHFVAAASEATNPELCVCLSAEHPWMANTTAPGPGELLAPIYATLVLLAPGSSLTKYRVGLSLDRDSVLPPVDDFSRLYKDSVQQHQNMLGSIIERAYGVLPRLNTVEKALGECVTTAALDRIIAEDQPNRTDLCKTGLLAAHLIGRFPSGQLIDNFCMPWSIKNRFSDILAEAIAAQDGGPDVSPEDFEEESLALAVISASSLLWPLDKATDRLVEVTAAKMADEFNF